MLLSAVSILVVAQSSSEIPEGLMNNSVFNRAVHPVHQITSWRIHALLYLQFNLLTPWSRVLLEKLTGFAASQEIPRVL